MVEPEPEIWVPVQHTQFVEQASCTNHAMGFSFKWSKSFWSRSPKFVFRLHSPGSNYCKPCHWLFICKFFKAGCKLASLSRMAFHRSCSFQDDCGIDYHVPYFIETCSATYFVGNFSSNTNINLTFPKTSGKRSLHLIQKSDHPC